MSRPRLGHIQFLNSLPFYYGLVKNDVLLDVDLVKAAPADLARMLVAGELDCAPIPAIEYARHADDLVLLPEISISSDGEVQSILLLSQLPAEELTGHTVALSNTSRTSQVLTRILLARHWNAEPSYVEMPPDLSSMMREADAGLLIGDDALRVFYQPTDLHKYDLGIEWQRYAGLPMVYAVWAMRREFAEQRQADAIALNAALEASMEYSRQHADEVAEYAARWEPFPAGFFHDYFEALRFHFTPRYREGMLRYFGEAAELGQLAAVPSLRILGEA